MLTKIVPIPRKNRIIKRRDQEINQARNRARKEEEKRAWKQRSLWRRSCVKKPAGLLEWVEESIDEQRLWIWRRRGGRDVELATTND